MGMIWFRCKGCGKTHGRPDASAGTMIFCDCGQGAVVPWESSAPEPPPAADVPAAPVLQPLAFDPTPIPGPPAPPTASRTGRPPDLADAPRRRRVERRDPDFCFNHQQVPRTATCTDCGESLCATCTVTFQDQPRCGPCKNFRARRLELPPPNRPLATASLYVALLFGPLAVCLLPWNASVGIRVVSLFALLPQAAALALGVYALRADVKAGGDGGQPLAITGIAAAAVTCVLTVLLHVYVARSWV